MALAGVLSAIYLLNQAWMATPSAPDEVQFTVAERPNGGLWDPSQKVPLMNPVLKSSLSGTRSLKHWGAGH